MWVIRFTPRLLTLTTVRLYNPRDKLILLSDLRFLLLCSWEQTLWMKDTRQTLGLLDETLSRTSATKCQKSLWRKVNFCLLRKSKIQRRQRYVDCSEIRESNAGSLGQICQCLFVCLFVRLFCCLLPLYLCFIAVSKQISAARSVCCMYRRNLSVWI